MGSIAFVFPGQGSQRVGMGRELARSQPDLLAGLYQEADRITGVELSRWCWEGSREDLRDTAVTQPALFLTGLATLRSLTARGVRADLVAGHSLGEYLALVAAGVLDWRDALRLVQVRGQLMADLNDRVPGAMVAVLGLPLPTVESVCAQARERTGELVEVANDNEPAQVVVAGQVGAVAEAVAGVRDAGAVRTVPLPVGAPFHCALMAPMREAFGQALEQVTFHDPVVQVISSVTAETLASGTQARSLLARQVTERVRWRPLVQGMAAQGVLDVVEAGPGKVLSGLVRRTEPGMRVHVTDAAVDGCDLVGRRLGRSASAKVA